MGRDGIDIEGVLAVIRLQYRLDWNGIHGVGHWRRVLAIGLRLAAATGADPQVVTAFALIHDARRLSDSSDPGHGKRAGNLARRLNPRFLHLDTTQLRHLVLACTYHAQGQTALDPTVGTCWDADRLDLSRLAICPEPGLLSTAAATTAEMLRWSWNLSEAERKNTRTNRIIVRADLE